MVCHTMWYTSPKKFFLKKPRSLYQGTKYNKYMTTVKRIFLSNDDKVYQTYKRFLELLEEDASTNTSKDTKMLVASNLAIANSIRNRE